MRSKVVTNLDTSDPLEAEILDMLSSMKSTHRRQERLRSLLKAGYNLLHKNLGKEQAIAQAFDRLDNLDISMILSLFAGNPDLAKQASPVTSTQPPALTSSRPLEESSLHPQTHSGERPGMAVDRVERPATPSSDGEAPKAVAERSVQQPPAKVDFVQPQDEKVTNEPAISIPARKPAPVYEEMNTSLDDFDVDFLDVDPSLINIEKTNSEPEGFVDPLTRLFGKR